jgi:hypothetical protein
MVPRGIPHQTSAPLLEVSTCLVESWLHVATNLNLHCANAHDCLSGPGNTGEVLPVLILSPLCWRGGGGG